MERLAFEEKVSTLTLYHLEIRRRWGNVIETQSILTEAWWWDIQGRYFFRSEELRISGHNLWIRRQIWVRTEMKRNVFILWVLNPWISVPQRALETQLLSSFRTFIALEFCIIMESKDTGSCGKMALRVEDLDNECQSWREGAGGMLLSSVMLRATIWCLCTQPMTFIEQSHYTNLSYLCIFEEGLGWPGDLSDQLWKWQVGMPYKFHSMP